MNRPHTKESTAISLALQGGGAHGAFTWGVLDRLLEAPHISFDAVSATSSGALNALAMAQGWISGGREGARTCLDVLWQRIAGHPQTAAWIFGSRMPAAQQNAQNLHRYFTSRQINPQPSNPVVQIAEVMFDFEQLRAEAPFRVHLAATRVRDGALVLFGPSQLGLDALLATTCLPQIFAPIEIGGESYWDGAWAGNPALEPLLGVDRARTVLAVLVQTLGGADIPATPEKIATRISELASTSVFLRELRSLVMPVDGIDPQSASTHAQAMQTVDLIEPGEPLHGFHNKQSFATAIQFLSALRDHGRQCASRWIEHPDQHRVGHDFPLFQSR